jgi:hypothetical protein
MFARFQCAKDEAYALQYLPLAERGNGSVLRIACLRLSKRSSADPQG